jgi:hypothetical protein
MKRKKNWEVQAVPCLCQLYPGICLTTEEKAWKNLRNHAHLKLIQIISKNKPKPACSLYLRTI